MTPRKNGTQSDAIASPPAHSTVDYDGLHDDAASPYQGMAVNRVLYTSAYLALFQAAQFGWSLSQLNFSKFNDKDDCNARPVVEGTCMMFPGHSKTQWTWVVNSWVVGGIVGAICSGRFSDTYGRKTTFLGNCVLMAAGAIVQAIADGLAVFMIGRAIAGLASGFATAMTNGYISEIAPPHLRNQLGVGYQITIGFGILIVCITFFFADSPSGWRYIAAFPAIMAIFFAVTAPRYMVESPTWLLSKGRQQDAEREIARLFGERNVHLALSWMQPEADPEANKGDRLVEADSIITSSVIAKMQMQIEAEANASEMQNPWKAIFSPTYRQQTILAVSMALALQFSGINAVFLYSSTLFTDAGISDDRVGSLIVNIVNLLPSFATGRLAARFGNRTMLLFGQLVMLVCAVGLTIARLLDISMLSIVFTSLYVAGFSVSLGPLAFVVAAEVFPEELRANGGSLTLFANWCGTLVIGIGFPYVADALNNLSFLPFVVTLVLFTSYMVKCLPETSGKTSQEIQAKYRNKL